VESEPAGATVTVNGDLRGVTPLDLGGLAYGSYDVKLDLKGFESRTTSVTLSDSAAKGDVKLTLPKLAPALSLVDILSTPFGAAVTIDGKSVGQTPLTDFRLAPGNHQVQIAKDAYEPYSGSVKVEVGKRARVDATLKAVPLPSPSPTPPPIDPNHAYENTPPQVETPARKISGSAAGYPDKGPRLKSGDQVSVSFDLVVDQNGDVETVTVTESAGKVVDDAVIQTVKKWKYTPAVRQGTRVKVLIHGKQTFRMG
jgi:TonB family protein